MPKGVNYPLFVPESCEAVAKLISDYRLSDAIVLLERKAGFGDPGAAALLGYLQLRNALANPNVDLIRSKLREAAESGDPYAEFVLAIGLRALGHENAAAQWMSRSANHLFPPAQAHLGRYMVQGIGFKGPCRKSAWEMYRLALKNGHVPTISFIADWLYTSPKVLIRIFGVLLFPVAALFVGIQFLAAPFSVRSFIHISDDQRPIMRVKPTI